MALIYCPECGKENVSDSADYCPGCGYGIKAHFARIAAQEQMRVAAEQRKRVEEAQRLAMKAEQERKMQMEAAAALRRAETRQKVLDIWKKLRIYAIIAGVLVVMGAVGYTLLEKLYLEPRSMYNQAEDYIDVGNYDAALAMLADLGDFGDTDMLYDRVYSGMANDAYESGLAAMADGDLTRAYDLLTGLDMDYVENPEDVEEAVEMIIAYKDSVWIGEWENSGFSFVRYTNVAIRDGKAYIVVTQNNGSNRYEAEYPEGNSFPVDLSGTGEGDVVMVNENQLQFPYHSAPNGYYVWARVGSGAESVYDSKFHYTPEPRVGMTREEVRESTWGNPKDINKHTYSWGTTEQWVYSGYRYIYFENGIVTSISE